MASAHWPKNRFLQDGIILGPGKVNAQPGEVLRGTLRDGDERVVIQYVKTTSKRYHAYHTDSCNVRRRVTATKHARTVRTVFARPVFSPSGADILYWTFSDEIVSSIPIER